MIMRTDEDDITVIETAHEYVAMAVKSVIQNEKERDKEKFESKAELIIAEMMVCTGADNIQLSEKITVHDVIWELDHYLINDRDNRIVKSEEKIYESFSAMENVLEKIYNDAFNCFKSNNTN